MKSENKISEYNSGVLLEAVSNINEFVLITKPASIDDNGPEIIYANEAIKRKWGYEDDELIGQSPGIFWGEETDRTVLQRMDDELKAGRKIEGEELVNYTKNGQKLWVKIDITPYLDKQTQNRYFVVTFRDISVYKFQEALLEGQLKILEMIVSETPLVEILLSIARFVENLSDEFRCAILLVDKQSKGDRLILAAAPNLSDEHKIRIDSLERTPDSATSGTAAFRKEKIFIDDVYTNPLWDKYVKNIRNSCLQGSWAAPILSSKKEVLGTVNLYFTGKSVKREYDEKLIEIAAYLAGIAIERRQEQQNLTENEAKFKALFESATDGIVIMEKDKFLECNDSFVRLLKSSQEKIKGKSLLDYSPAYQADNRPSSTEIQNYIKTALSGKPRNFEWKCKSELGSEIYTHISLNRIDIKDNVYLQAIVHDITEQREIEAENKRNSELFKQLFNNMPAGIVTVDLENKILMTNEGFRNMFGYANEEAIGKDVDELIVPEKYQFEGPILSQAALQGDTFQIETVRKHKNGQLIPVLLYGVVVKIGDKPLALFGIYIDISERLDNEKKVRRALKEKETLLAEIHHRVKNNLAVISGLLELQLGSSDDQIVRDVLNESQSRIQSIALIHEKLYHSETLSNIAFDEYVRDLIRTIAKTYYKNNNEISFDILTDRVFLSINQAIPCALILNELIVNIYKHAFRGRAKGNVIIQLHNEHKNISLIVQDDGCGIPEDFNFKKPKSLGMKLINTLTRQLNGESRIENKNGTRFALNFMLD